MTEMVHTELPLKSIFCSLTVEGYKTCVIDQNIERFIVFAECIRKCSDGRKTIQKRTDGACYPEDLQVDSRTREVHAEQGIC